MHAAAYRAGHTSKEFSTYAPEIVMIINPFANFQIVSVLQVANTVMK